MPDPIYLATAVEIVLRAGDIQRAGERSGFRVDKKGSIDLVTEIDLACERMCRETIGERFPDHDVLAEELGGTPPGRSRSRFRWVFDPLDGTTNYAHGYPNFCVSIALEFQGETIIGVVYDPMREELFTAERGAGATLNNRPIRVSKTDDLMQSLLSTGFPYDIKTSKLTNLDHWANFAMNAQALRRDGAAALDLCYTACGRFDGFWELNLSPWDMAAGALIVSEAGGRVTDFKGQLFSHYKPEVIASNGLIHDRMIEVLAMAHA